MRSRGLIAAIGAAMLLFPAGASAQEPEQVTGLTVTQDVGFTTLKWNPVAGATDYQIERAPAARRTRRPAPSSASGSRSARSRPDKPAFADSGFKLGDSFRVARARPLRHRHDRAVLKPYSDAGERRDARPSRPGGAADGVGEARHRRRPSVAPATYTTTAEEETFTAALDAASDRVRAGRADADDPEPAAGPVHPRLPEAARHRGGDLGEADVLGQLQRARQRGLRPRDVLHDGPPARHHAGSGDPRHAEQDHGADHAVEQPGRPRAQPARQLDRAGPQPRPRADRAGRDQGAGAADPRLHAGRLDRQPRGRQRGPADPLRAPPERARAALQRGQVDGHRLDVRRRRAVRLVDGPVQHRRRQPRGHPAQHRLAEERHQHAR